MSTATATAPTPADLTSRSQRPSLATLWRVETRKMVDTRAGKWLLGLTVLFALGGTVAGLLADDPSAAEAFLTTSALASILLPVVGVLLVTSEWSQRTALLTFVMVPNRERVAVSKALAATTLGLTLTVLCLLFALVGSAIAGGGVEISAADIGQGLLFQLITVLIGVALGFALRISPLAIVAYFAAPTLFGLIGAISASVGDVTSWLDQSGLVALAELDPTGEEWGKAAVTFVVWAILPGLFGWWRLRHEDVS